MYQSFKKRLYLPMNNLQFFGDDGGQGGQQGDGQGNGQQQGAQGDGGQQGNAQVTYTLDAVQSWLNESEEGKKWLQSYGDSLVTKGIKTYEEKTLPKKIEDEIAKRYPPETEEQKQLRDLREKMERLEAEKIRESLKNKGLSFATENGLPTKLVDFFIGADEESTLKNLGVFQEVFQAAVQAAVEGKFKDNGREPHKSSDKPGGTLTLEAINKMSADEINARWDEVQKVLQQK